MIVALDAASLPEQSESAPQGLRPGKSTSPVSALLQPNFPRFAPTAAADQLKLQTNHKDGAIFTHS
jgi:hypothetical protein